jgi:hypothetical protein
MTHVDSMNFITNRNRMYLEILKGMSHMEELNLY